MNDANPRQEGRDAESLFLHVATLRGWHVEQSSLQQNMHDHIDCFIAKHHRKYAIDIKARKRQQRYAPLQSDWIAIEFVAVTYPSSNIVNFASGIFDPCNPYFAMGSGRPGWIYGKSDYLAFHMDNEFWLVERLKLLELCIVTVDFSQRAYSSYDAKYLPYSRVGRGDLVSYIHKDDVEPLAYKWSTSSLCSESV